jgi:hypothetical protein
MIVSWVTTSVPWVGPVFRWDFLAVLHKYLRMFSLVFILSIFFYYFPSFSFFFIIFSYLSLSSVEIFAQMWSVRFYGEYIFICKKTFLCISVVLFLFSLKWRLETEFHFDVWGLAFDGDSHFDTLHHECHLGWINAFQGNPQVFPEISTRSVVISDPLHLMKRIRCRWICRIFYFGLGEPELLLVSTKNSKNRVSAAGRVSAVIP